jgi:hypothetical protein
MGMERWWNDTDRRKTEVLGKKHVTVKLYVPEISSWTDEGLNLGLRGDRPVTNRPTHGTAMFILHNMSTTIQSVPGSKRTTSLL